MKAYLGDGVYASIENGMLKLETSNGEHITNTIWLEPSVLDSLLSYIRTIKRSNIGC
jgi:hypothetical protein